MYPRHFEFMSLHFEPILSGVSYSIKPKSQTPQLKFHHYWLEYGWEYRCAYKSTDWSNNRCWRTIHWGRSPLLCATEIAGSCPVCFYARNSTGWTQNSTSTVTMPPSPIISRPCTWFGPKIMFKNILFGDLLDNLLLHEIDNIMFDESWLSSWRGGPK